ncbi:MAG: GNAT family N-acetyltransferase [Lachnospiraceae bacterium]|nr:GNAT family N-acetyltransferase [Lachnospiraceae bacterium]
MGYVEIHLDEKLDLKTVAEAAHYSKYHLHRMFTKTVGMTLHDYIQRRRLSEAAKYLAFSRKPLLEIALIAGYESQQAFTGVFKAMYKQTPLEYREKGAFYPLQSAFTLNRDPSAPEVVIRNIAYAAVGDIPDWMEFISLVIDGFPCLDRARHLKRLRRYVEQRQALLARDKEIMVGAAAFSPQTGRIDFLGIHPQYRRHGIAEAFLDRIRRNEFRDREVSVTTFREGDKADTGQRAAYRRLGFAESELLTEFGYPVQRLVLRTDWEGVSDE